LIALFGFILLVFLAWMGYGTVFYRDWHSFLLPASYLAVMIGWALGKLPEWAVDAYGAGLITWLVYRMAR